MPSHRHASPRLTTAYAVAGAVLSATYFRIPSDVVAAWWYIALGAFSIVGIAAGVFLFRPPRAQAWVLLAVSVGCSVAGDLLFNLEELASGVVPFPGPADAFYLTGYPLAALGIWHMVRDRGQNPAAMLDSGIAVVTGAVVLWHFVVGPYFQTEEISRSAQVVSASYLIGDLLVVGFALHLVFTSGLRTPSLWLLIVGTFSMLAADVVFALVDSAGDYYTQHWVDAGWFGQYVLYGAAALHPSMSRASSGAQQATQTNSRSVLWLAPFGLIGPLLTALPGSRTTADLVVLAVSQATLFTLVVARLAGLISSLTRSMSERARLADALRTQAETDPLTHLANRSVFAERVQHALAAGDALVGFCDLDNFKAINDSQGHAAGDELLRAVASRLEEAVDGVGSLVARLGGDEFAVLMDGAVSAPAAGERLVAVFEAPFELSSGVTHISASVGVSMGAAGTGYSAILADADVAMYMAKRRGKGQFAVFDPTQRELVLGYPHTVTALKDGLDRGEVVVHYQPVIELDSEAIVGAEALVRWQRPGYGLLRPQDFLPAAEAGGLIAQLDLFVLTSALTELVRWRRRDNAFRVMVNLGAGSLGNGHLAESILDALRAADVEPAALVLEITEHVLVADRVSARIELELLSAAGVTIALDDFGTGYSSLLYLQEFPVDVLKLDRRFVATASKDAEGSALLRGAVRLAETLGLQIVAEGVETTAQLAGLRRLGCAYGQGYLFSGAVPAADVDVALSASHSSADASEWRR